MTEPDLTEPDLAELERVLVTTSARDPKHQAAIQTLIQRLRETEDRLAILNDPGTLEAITQGMWDYAESKGHPKASSSHAYGFLIDLIESQESRIAQLEGEVAYAQNFMRSRSVTLSAWDRLQKLERVLETAKHHTSFYPCDEGPLADAIAATKEPVKP